MLEQLTNNAWRWRIGSTLFAFVGMTLLSLFFSRVSLGSALGSGLVLGVIQFFLAPEIRRLGQERDARRQR